MKAETTWHAPKANLTTPLQKSRLWRFSLKTKQKPVTEVWTSMQLTKCRKNPDVYSSSFVFQNPRSSGIRRNLLRHPLRLIRCQLGDSVSVFDILRTGDVNSIIIIH